jgi:hypothetical protein
MKIEDFKGKHFLTGVEFGEIKSNDKWGDNANTIDFILDGKTFSAVEDPDDGYRSSMEDIVENRDGVIIKNTFSQIEVLGVIRKDEDIIDFIDTITGRKVLSIGTDYSDYYYPSFVCDFIPENMNINVKDVK